MRAPLALPLTRSKVLILVGLLAVVAVVSAVPGVLAKGNAIEVSAAPTSAAPGSEVTFTWDITGTGATAHTAVHWDTQPGNPADFTSYAQATPDFAQIDPPDAAPKTYSARVKMPLLTGGGYSTPPPVTVYYVIHAIIDGGDYYAPEGERQIAVQAAGTAAAITPRTTPTTASSGERLTFSWDITGSGSISHTAVHWDTQPGNPADFTSYGQATGDYAEISPPHQAPKTYEVGFAAPPSGTIYYVIHAIVDGQHVYAPGGERTLQVSGAAAGGGGTPTLTIVGIVVAVIVVGVGSVVALRRRRRVPPMATPKPA